MSFPDASHIEAIYIAIVAQKPMQRVSEIEAIPGRGLSGDRYALGTGYYSPGDVCQVTLIEVEAIERMGALFGVHVSNGEHRRNIVTRGIVHTDLRGRRFAIGSVVFEYDRSRPPCSYLQRITEPGMTRAMGEGAGIGANVLEGGILREGDPIRILPGYATRRFPRLP